MRKKILYVVLLLMFLFTACGKAETNKKDEQAKVEQGDIQKVDDNSQIGEQQDVTADNENGLDVSINPLDTTLKSKEETKKSTDEEKKVTTSSNSTDQKTSGKAEQKPSNNTTTQKPSNSNAVTTQNPPSSNDATTQKPSNNTTDEKPSNDTEVQNPSDNTTTQNPPSDSNNSDASESQLKAEADSNASKYMNYYQEVLRLVNEIRAEVGVAPLTLDMTLCKAASMRALEMDYNNEISHTRPNGTEWYTVLDFYGVSYGIGGENIGAGHRSPASIVNGWKNSPHHYENMIVVSYTKMGVGYSSTGVGHYGYYWCQLFTN